jgi:hypothetical protein
MADETTTDKPLAQLAEAEKNVNPPVVAKDSPEAVSLEPGTTPPDWTPQPEPASATERLRAFEDKHFGEDAVRINGRIERGSGSPYQMAHPDVRRQHQALERLIETEQKLIEAHTALMAADQAHDEAEQAVEAAEKDADGISAE